MRLRLDPPLRLAVTLPNRPHPRLLTPRLQPRWLQAALAVLATLVTSKQYVAVSSAVYLPSLPADLQLVGLGASPDQAAQLLAAAGGNVDMAASMLFS